jgi:N-acetyl-gamma-glutamylphosphate reductase
MKRLVIVGASGMVGGYALRYALQNPDVKHVLSIGRKKLCISHTKLTEVQQCDSTASEYHHRERTGMSRIANEIPSSGRIQFLSRAAGTR